MNGATLAVQVHEKRPGFFEVALAGRLDTVTHALFEERIAFVRTRLVRSLHLDLGRLSYISSVGLRAVLTASRAVKDCGGVFSMSGLQPQIAKVFEIANVLPKEEIFGSVAEADHYLDMIQRKELDKQRTR